MNEYHSTGCLLPVKPCLCRPPLSNQSGDYNEVDEPSPYHEFQQPLLLSLVSQLPHWLPSWYFAKQRGILAKYAKRVKPMASYHSLDIITPDKFGVESSRPTLSPNSQQVGSLPLPKDQIYHPPGKSYSSSRATDGGSKIIPTYQANRTGIHWSGQDDAKFDHSFWSPKENHQLVAQLRP